MRELDHKEGWMPKNWCFWTVVVEKTLESPLDCKEIKPVNPKRNQPWISLERLMLKLQYFGHLMQRRLTGKDPNLGKIEGRKKRRQQKMKWLDRITDSMDMNLGKLQEVMRDREACHAIVHGVRKSLTWSSNWTTTNSLCYTSETSMFNTH